MSELTSAYVRLRAAQNAGIPNQALELHPSWGSGKAVRDSWMVVDEPVQSKRKRAPVDAKGVAENPPSAGDHNVQNNIDTLWTWSINGAKVAGSLVLLTGAVKIVQGILSYWRDEVIVWWNRMKRRWNTLSTDEISSDDE